MSHNREPRTLRTILCLTETCDGQDGLGIVEGYDRRQAQHDGHSREGPLGSLQHLGVTVKLIGQTRRLLGVQRREVQRSNSKVLQCTGVDFRHVFRGRNIRPWHSGDLGRLTLPRGKLMELSSKPLRALSRLVQPRHRQPALRDIFGPHGDVGDKACEVGRLVQPADPNAAASSAWGAVMPASASRAEPAA